MPMTAHNADWGRDNHSTRSTPRGWSNWLINPISGAYSHRHTTAAATGIVTSGKKKISR